MDSVLSQTFGPAQETQVVEKKEAARARFRDNPLILIACLFAWVGMGGFLSWLVGDFSRAYGEAHATAVSLLIFSMFLIAALVVCLIRWSSFGRAELR